MKIQFKNRVIPILLGLFLLVAVLFFACSLEEKITPNNKVNNENDNAEIKKQPIDYTYGEITETITNESKKVSIGNTLLEFELESYWYKLDLTTLEKTFLDDLKKELKNKKTKINKNIIKGQQIVYFDKTKTNISHTNIYSRDYYFTSDGESLFLDEWEKVKKNSHNNTINYSVGQNSDQDNTVYLSDVYFQEGTTLSPHSSTLNIASTTTSYTGDSPVDAIISAISNINGTITLGNIQPLSFWEGISMGRIRLLDGFVVESQLYLETANVATLPTHINESTGEIYLSFYTEDYWDFDYNDSFVVLKIRTLFQRLNIPLILWYYNDLGEWRLVNCIVPDNSSDHVDIPLNFTIENALPNSYTTFNLEIEYDNNRTGSPTFRDYASFSGTVSGDTTWTPNWNGITAGGNATLTANYTSGGNTLTYNREFRLDGINPSVSRIKSAIGNSSITKRLFKAIVKHESSYKQFNSPREAYEYEPNWGSEEGEDGWGLSQIDPPHSGNRVNHTSLTEAQRNESRQNRWNWFDNLQSGIDRFSDKYRDVVCMYLSIINANYAYANNGASFVYPTPNQIAQVLLNAGIQNVDDDFLTLQKTLQVQAYNGVVNFYVRNDTDRPITNQCLSTHIKEPDRSFRTCWFFRPNSTGNYDISGNYNDDIIFKKNQNNYVKKISDVYDEAQ